MITLAVFTALGVIALLVGHFTQQVSLTPKLALDLEGGTQLILTPKLQEGAEDRAVTQEDMNEAIGIIRQRVDASGVAEAEISTLGTNNIVVAIPGEADENILDLVRSSATMRFRPVLQVDGPQPLDSSQFAQSGDDDDFADASPQELAEALADADQDGVISTEPSGTPENNSDPAWISEADVLDFFMLDCLDPANLTGDRADNPEEVLVACGVDGDAKYILGPVDVEGTNLKSAVAGMASSPTGQPTGQYSVSLELDKEGTKAFADSSQRLYDFMQTDATRNRFAIVLDGNVIMAPSMNAPILTGQAEITGDFSPAEAQALANQLQFGSLPLNFEVQSEQQISATLGSDHLEKGLWAGLIGLILVVLYMVWQYRGLALLSAGSLLVAGALTYLVVTLLSWGMGFRLSLPGVAGLMIAIGFTADSFIVYFERIRDEVRDGRPLTIAVEDGWRRARRTILISDAVNIVAATVLYVLAVGGVQGFAFALGITTVVDLVVVFMFTHPMLSLLTKTRFFGGGHPLSGLAPTHLGASGGAAYQGRGRMRSSQPTSRAEAGGRGALSDGGGKKSDRTTSKPKPVKQLVGVPSGLSVAEKRRLERQKAAQEVSAPDTNTPDEDAPDENTRVETSQEENND